MCLYLQCLWWNKKIENVLKKRLKEKNKKLLHEENPECRHSLKMLEFGVYFVYGVSFWEGNTVMLEDTL